MRRARATVLDVLPLSRSVPAGGAGHVMPAASAVTVARDNPARAMLIAVWEWIVAIRGVLQLHQLAPLGSLFVDTRNAFRSSARMAHCPLRNGCDARSPPLTQLRIVFRSTPSSLDSSRQLHSSGSIRIRLRLKRRLGGLTTSSLQPLSGLKKRNQVGLADHPSVLLLLRAQADVNPVLYGRHCDAKRRSETPNASPIWKVRDRFHAKGFPRPPSPRPAVALRTEDRFFYHLPLSFAPKPDRLFRDELTRMDADCPCPLGR